MASRRRRQADQEDDLTEVRRLNINKTFDDFALGTGQPAAKKQRLEDPSAEAGGFLAEDDAEGGGFMLEDAEEGGGFLAADDDEPQVQTGLNLPSTRRTRDEEDDVNVDMPFSRIVPALKSLGLPFDDEIVDTFRAAADGEEGEGEHADDLLTVDRDTFTRVCAVLFANEADALSSGSEEPYKANGVDDDEDAVIDASARKTRSKGKAPAIQLSGDDDDDVGSSAVSSTVATPATKAKGKGSRGKRKTTTGELSSSKRATVDKVFKMFKPVNTPQGPAIDFNGIRAVAQDLKQSLNDNEINEMLQYASGSSGHFVTRDHFEDIMRSVRAV